MPGPVLTRTPAACRAVGSGGHSPAAVNGMHTGVPQHVSSAQVVPGGRRRRRRTRRGRRTRASRHAQAEAVGGRDAHAVRVRGAALRKRTARAADAFDVGRSVVGRRAGRANRPSARRRGCTGSSRRAWSTRHRRRCRSAAARPDGRVPRDPVRSWCLRPCRRCCRQRWPRRPPCCPHHCAQPNWKTRPLRRRDRNRPVIVVATTHRGLASSRADPTTRSASSASDEP